MSSTVKTLLITLGAFISIMIISFFVNHSEIFESTKSAKADLESTSVVYSITEKLPETTTETAVETTTEITTEAVVETTTVSWEKAISMRAKKPAPVSEAVKADNMLKTMHKNTVIHFSDTNMKKYISENQSLVISKMTNEAEITALLKTVWDLAADGAVADQLMQNDIISPLKTTSDEMEKQVSAYRQKCGLSFENNADVKTGTTDTGAAVVLITLNDSTSNRHYVALINDSSGLKHFTTDINIRGYNFKTNEGYLSPIPDMRTSEQIAADDKAAQEDVVVIPTTDPLASASYDELKKVYPGKTIIISDDPNAASGITSRNDSISADLFLTLTNGLQPVSVNSDADGNIHYRSNLQ